MISNLPVTASVTFLYSLASSTSWQRSWTRWPAAAAMSLTNPSSQKPDPSLSGPHASNPFTAELGLLTKLVAPRISHAKDDASLPAPKPIGAEAGRKRRSVPPLNELEVAVGEVQTLPTHGKMQLGVSSTNHSGLKEMLISRKARHEHAFEAYKKKTGELNVELEARTAHVARSFKQLMALNDAELKTMFEELADDFLLQMEMEEVDSSWVRIDEELHRRFAWVDQFETDLGKVEDERREMIEAELTTLLESLVATAHLLPPQLERLVETEAHEVRERAKPILRPQLSFGRSLALSRTADLSYLFFCPSLFLSCLHTLAHHLYLAIPPLHTDQPAHPLQPRGARGRDRAATRRRRQAAQDRTLRLGGAQARMAQITPRPRDINAQVLPTFAGGDRP